MTAGMVSGALASVETVSAGVKSSACVMVLSPFGYWVAAMGRACRAGAAGR
jgi:hypothetical protein